MSNNSFLSIETIDTKSEDVLKARREEEGRLVRILEALKGLSTNEDWSSLKKEILDGLTERLERDLKEEAQKGNPDTNKLNRISGELTWSRKFSDLKKQEDMYRNQLQAVRKNING